MPITGLVVERARMGHFEGRGLVRGGVSGLGDAGRIKKRMKARSGVRQRRGI